VHGKAAQVIPGAGAYRANLNDTMNDPNYDTELIERYFDQDLTSDEKALFERRLQHDPGFRRLFDQERLLIGAIKFEGALTDLEYLRATETELSKKGRGSSVMLWYYVAAAACLLTIVAAIFYLKPDSPQRMASKYTEENLMYLSTTMSDGSDSLRLGIAAYNSNDYDKAGRIFESIAQKTGSLEAIKNLGLTYLANGEYDKALQQFDMLSNRDDIYVNQGPFYKAVTLMLRSAPGDEEVAKEILQEVVQKQLPGHKVASGWLDRW
jgi:tetratricopeptide (TPR) repeat protein